MVDDTDALCIALRAIRYAKITMRYALSTMYRIVTALVWTNSLKCPRSKEAFIGSRAQPEIQ